MTTGRVTIIAACIALVSAVAVALIQNWKQIFTGGPAGPVAVMGPLQQNYLKISSNEPAFFAGLHYIARPSTGAGRFAVDLLYRGNVVASHEIEDRKSDGVLLEIANCAYFKIFPGRGSAISIKDEKETSISAEIYVQTTCTFEN